ncbi:hypothetical protein ACKWTF_002052 [Chironomus riparius]
MINLYDFIESITHILAQLKHDVLYQIYFLCSLINLYWYLQNKTLKSTSKCEFIIFCYVRKMTGKQVEMRRVEVKKNETLNPCVSEAETLLFVMHEKIPPAPTRTQQKASE